MLRRIYRDEDPPIETDGGGGGGGVETDESGNPVIDQSTKPIETAPKFDSGALFNDEGVMSDGRFDVKDHKFSADFLEENPHVAKLLESQVNGQKKITEYGQGKVELGEPLLDEQVMKLSFERNEDGKIPKETRDALLNRPISEGMLEMYVELMDMAQDANRSANSVWWQEQYERMGGGSTGDGQSKFMEMQNWFKDPANMAPETAAEITAALKMHTMRPHALAQLEAAYDAKNDTPEPKHPLATNTSTPGDPAPGPENKGGGPQTSTGHYYSKDGGQQDTQYTNDIMAANGNAAKIHEAKQKLERTMKHFNQIELV